MLDSITAKDIMIPLDHYPHVPYWFTIRQAIVEIERVLLTTGERQSLPRVVLVFDEEYRLMGLVRRRDLLRGMGSNALQEIIERAGERDPSMQRDLSVDAFDKSYTIETLRERSERPVNEVMMPIRVTVRADSSVSEVMNTVVLNNVSFAPVLGREGVVGVVRTVDIVHVLAEHLE